MKISKLKIRNLFGIKEYESDGKNVELQGSTGAGKTSVLDAIKYALTNKSDREFVIHKGSEEGEVFVEFDNGLSIHRKARTNKADYKSIKQLGDKVEKNEGFIRQFFTELQLNPIEFSKMDIIDQNRIILDLIDFKWDMNWIKEQFGEIPPDVNYEQNILNVLFDIQMNEGHYFKTREDVNREIRNKLAFIEEIGTTLPTGYNAKKWKDVNLGELYKKIEVIRTKNQVIEKAKILVNAVDNKMRGFEADYEIERNVIEKETSSSRNSLEKQIAELKNKIKEYETEISNLEEKKISKLEIAKKTYEAKVAEFQGTIKEYEPIAKLEIVPFDELQQEADYTEKMKGHINEYNRMVELQSDVENLKKKSEDLTAKIEKARTLPGEILEKSNIPVDGLTIKDGIPLINGLPISNLSDGEKFELCISVATKDKDSLQMLLIDGIEKLSTEKRTNVYKKLKDRGVQFIATRTTDEEDLTVIQL